MKPVNSHHFNGVRYLIEIEPHDGACDPPPGGRYEPTLRIPGGVPYGNRRGAQNALTTLVHEALHASGWSNRENTIDRASKDIARLLWRLGYRRAKNGR